MSNTAEKIEPNLTPVIQLNSHQQIYHYWELSTLIRRGWKNPNTNRYNKLSGETMVSRINYYMTRFNWNDKMMAKIAELHEIAYNTLRTENESNTQADSGDVRSTS